MATLPSWRRDGARLLAPVSDGGRSPAPIPGGEDVVAKKVARFLGDAEVAVRVLKWAVVLAAGGFRFAWRLVRELCGRALYRTVVVVEMKGVIADDRSARHALRDARYWCWGGGPVPECAAGEGVISVSRCERALERAFSYRRARAVVLKVNSPGGTASESALLYARVASLKARARAKLEARQARLLPRVFRFVTRRAAEAPPEVLAFVDEICTSGGYFAACAADDIVATPCALLGSIGVISRSFGYQRQLRKIGVERRVLAAGAAKAGLDPYLPQSRPGIAREKRVLEELHDEFVATVKRSRGDRLDARRAAAIGSAADAADWSNLTPRALASLWPLRWLLNGARAARGDGLFDGSVHGAKTALELGLVDKVVDETFTEALKQRYGQRIFLKKLATNPPTGLDALFR